MFKKTIGCLNFLLFSSLLLISCSDKTGMEKVKEAGNDARRDAKAAVREVEEKTCEMVNGKMECAFEKIEHAIEEGSDAAEDAMD